MREETESTEDRVILNLSQVDFIDSRGLGAIVAAMKQLGADRRMDLSCLNENVDRVFRLTRMDTVFQIHETLGDAFAQ
ncbi:anti-anti-sigma factor [Shimia gijangensis]|uniref:Anti-anti-sigma factor n=1 Tax=Shimia gijangensis TaxID=1470563 RepID=A0A1M6B345_9RHOB|nr:anti-anti-sigma factor [Shimia gijangensis]